MTTFFVIVAVLIIIFALAMVAYEFREDRDWHQANAEQLARQLAASNARLEQALNEHASCPTPYRHVRGAW